MPAVSLRAFWASNRNKPTHEEALLIMTESIRPWMQMAKKGDEQARKYVLEECQPLIQNLAEQHWKYHFRSYYDYHEVVNIAYLGICECIHDYDCTAKIPVTKLIEENINKLLNHDIYERHKYYDSPMVKTFENDGEATDLPLDVPDNKIMGPMEQVIYHEVREALFSALAKMAEKEKRAFALHYFKGKSIGEIAKLLQCSQKHVYRILARGKAVIQQEIPV